MVEATGNKTIAIYVYEGVEPIDVGGTYGVFSMAKRVIADLTFFTVAESEAPLVMSSGLRLLPDHHFGNCPPADVLIVCGGPGWPVESEKKEVIRFIREQSAHAIIASACTGGLILARTGLLDGLTATTRRKGIGSELPPLKVMGDLPGHIDPIEALIVDCGTIVTGGGVSLAIDLSLHLIEKLFGPVKAQDCAELIEYDAAWQANKQRLPVVHLQPER